ncbi:MAG TPA: zinc-ribbon domain-containing protein [Candidatus Bathyarchaeia archaeon]|nr:zinc-ribbon domain-containing protein [Candidatus Bathyarchaeia archaeon]
MTIFCPSCGTANRDDADMCSECGSAIPKFSDDSLNDPTSPSPLPPSSAFGIYESYPPPPPPDDFGIDVAYTPPPPPQQGSSGYSPAYSPYGTGPARQRIICERCGTVLRPDDSQCPGCGQPYQANVKAPVIPPPPPSNQPSPYSPSPPYPPASPYAPRQPQQLPSPGSPSTQKGPPPEKIAKCAKCGAIVYDYETRCSNCNRILAPPTRTTGDPTKDPLGKAPPGTARCGRCNAIVYPHHTVCPNCAKPLTPVAPPPRGPSQRITRCRRCGHTVYPTDSHCPSCGRKLELT